MPNKDEILNFSLNVEDIVRQKEIPYMEAIIVHCETVGMEVELAAKLVSSTLKSKLQIEAEELNLLPRSNTIKLPL